MERRPLTATQLSIVCNSLEVSEIEARQILLSHDNDFNSWKTSWVQDVKRRTRAQTPKSHPKLACYNIIKGYIRITTEGLCYVMR